MTPKPITQDGIDVVSSFLGVTPAHIWTVLAVETSGCGFLPDLRLVIRYERHIFHRVTQGRFSVPGNEDFSAETRGDANDQFEAFYRALEADADAAYQSISFGLGQIMGMNHVICGYKSAIDMVRHAEESEDAQIAQMASFIKVRGIATDLKDGNWVKFAEVYNGPRFALNMYDVKLARAFAKCSAGPLPDLNVRAAQLYLRRLGMDTGPIDGMRGKKTAAALEKYVGYPVGYVSLELIESLRADVEKVMYEGASK